MVNLATRLWLGSTNHLVSVDKFLRSHFEYVEEKIETLQAPTYMLSGMEMSGIIKGDCDDISTLHAALLTCMDIPVRFVAIRSVFENPNFDHVYIEAQDINGEWIPYDVTLPLGTDIQYFGRLTVKV